MSQRKVFWRGVVVGFLGGMFAFVGALAQQGLLQPDIDVALTRLDNTDSARLLLTVAMRGCVLPYRQYRIEEDPRPRVHGISTDAALRFKHQGIAVLDAHTFTEGPVTIAVQGQCWFVPTPTRQASVL